MKLTYFGTAAAEGWPGIFCHCVYCERAKQLGGKNIRTRSQALLDDTLLFDLGRTPICICCGMGLICQTSATF